MRSILMHLKWMAYNIFTMISNIFIRRDDGIWLIGSWMGNRYADNSRYLYQYLSKNKLKYNIKKVVWVSSNEKIVSELTRNGYECYLMKSKKGIYFHLKAGVHVICNMHENVNGYSGDIYGRFSWNAKKLQICHGVGIKATGVMRSDINKLPHQSFVKKILSNICNKSIFIPGGWNKAYWLATSEQNKKVQIEDSCIESSRIFISSYPRYLKSSFYLEEEKEVIEYIKNKKKNGYVVVSYFPTFRSNYDEYIDPLKDDEFMKELSESNILWVEKTHYASIEDIEEKKANNILTLESEFDINIILSEFDIVVSDYSSVITDALVNDIVTISYTPDYDYYKEKDRGFIAEYEVYNPGEHVYTPQELMECIKHKIEFGINYSDLSKLETSKRILVNDLTMKEDDIVRTLLNVIKNEGDLK